MAEGVSSTVKLAVLITGVIMFGSSLSMKVADAQSTQAECYEVASPGLVFAATDELPETAVKTWCYRQERDGSRVVYHVDELGQTSPELTIVIYPDRSLKHASLNQGKLSVHMTNANWNPMGIPLSPPEGAKQVKEPITEFSPYSDRSIDRSIQILNSIPINERPIFTGTVREGKFASSGFLPWRGYWYAQSSGKMHIGGDSPMAKYDRFVERRIGMNPGAQAWERRVHRTGVPGWYGHCNGWSGASILRAEPTAPVKDPFSGIEFSIADQKALWIEFDYCPLSAFFGRRNNGGGSDGDVSPKDFHNVLTYYIGELKKPVVMDLLASDVVENRVVSGYEMDIKRIGEYSFSVRAKLTIHSYDKKPLEDLGPAGVFYRTYSYTLRVDEEGKPASGAWRSRHPDFFWIPVSKDSCKRANPYVHSAWLEEIFRLSTRPSETPIVPALGLMPAEPREIPKDLRPPGASPKVEATPPPADAQPDGEDSRPPEREDTNAPNPENRSGNEGRTGGSNE